MLETNLDIVAEPKATVYTYAAVQNGVILDVFDNHDDAVSRVKSEMTADWFSIAAKKKLRKLLKKRDQIALHRYSVITIKKVEEIK